jgi:adenylate kinase family enzyme
MSKQLSKIIVVGTSGSGKTTLAQSLSSILNIPCTDMDDLYWLPNWEVRNEEDFLQDMKVLVDGDQWVLSGNCSRISGYTWPKAEMIIWLDFPLHTLLWRTLKRSIRRSIRKEPCCGGNQESFLRFFSKHSIFYWVFRSYRRRGKMYSKYFADPTNKPHKLVHLKSSDEVRKFLLSLSVSVK